MSNYKAAPATDPIQDVANTAGRYQVYSAGGMFSQHELATNVMIREAVWQLSGGRFELCLPQSVELEKVDAAYFRNMDLLAVIKADIILVRFDGLELDSGTVLEYALAKQLGKPAVILRTDFRGIQTGLDLPPDKNIDEPYNLMVKNWPRTVEVHIESILDYVGFLAEARKTLGAGGTVQAMINAEQSAIQQGVEDIANKLIHGMEAAIKMESPYPPEYRETVYKAARYSPGSGFDQLLTEEALAEIIQRLRNNGTL